ncbi:MAG TPA: asparagine synthase (glutamine-hydrolyzing) [Candidatus Binatus sp.]|jgi:asparagine synthase (glutamine-hydrolysing)|nr:asparagine synthase (glutamine-hydrolyzing) [Candidatus Binatus sp.]
MCGIVGVICPTGALSSRTVSTMVEAISHRGPDDSGFEQLRSKESDVWLGNTRLAILDLSSSGHQPMTDPATGNSIIYNGEVYNYRELRDDLLKRGIRFQSDTDTEVVLKAYGVFGPACVERFRGMFAFCVWDSQKHELFLCRDRAGKKPLYHCSPRPGFFLFASEVRALLASEIPKRRLDPAGVEIFLTNGFLVSPRTLVTGIDGVMPGHWLRVGTEGQILESRRYWSLPDSKSCSNGDESLLHDREELQEAVKLRMISDVPLGAFLSGGLDSSTICALMSKAAKDVRTFSVTFRETQFDESPYSRWVARRFETQHTEISLDKKAFYDLLPSALAGMDQPTFDGVNTFCVAQAARHSGLKVALSGMGADELYGGYKFFDWATLLSKTRFLSKLVPSSGVQFVRDHLYRSVSSGLAGVTKAMELLGDEAVNGSDKRYLIAAYQTTQTLFPSWTRRRLRNQSSNGNLKEVELGLPREFLKFLLEEIESGDSMSCISKIAFRLFLGERCLRDVDTMSMAVSLEVRAPFVDHAFIENVLGVSGKKRCKGVPDKPVLARMVRSLLGEEYPWRKKQGFIFPFQTWLRDLNQWEFFKDIANDVQLCQAAGLEPQAVSALFNSFFQSGREMPWSRPWAIFVLLAWCKRNRVSL